MPEGKNTLSAIVNDEKLREQTKSLMNIYKSFFSNPTGLWQAAFNANVDMWSAMMGRSKKAPDKVDRRFADPIWNDNPAYRALSNGYLQWCDSMQSWADGLGLEGRDKERAKLLLATIADTLSPTNTLVGNPAAVRKTLESGGKNLVDGTKNFISDMVDNNGMPSTVDKSAFKVGENLATTPGKVVYTEPHLEVIQYNPQTPEVYEIPIFIVPPQINKFYVWDLAPERSIVEFLLRQGFQVFIVSWFNPTAAQSDWGLDSYIAALDRAAAVASEISKSDKLNMVGACSGGISTATLLGYWKAKGTKRANSLTMPVTVLDTDGTANTNMGLMTSLEVMEIARFTSHRKGVLEGKDLAKIFAWLRPNDLIWSYWVSNYLLGQDPPVFDILFWNADTTSMAGRLHGDFIDVLEGNALTKDGALEVLGEKINLGQVDCDALIVGGTTDHITPWEGSYRTMNVLGGTPEFILSNSGHVQALINPPTNKKAIYMLNTGAHDSPGAFMEGAEEHVGTWWLYWAEWLRDRAGKTKKAPRTLGNKTHKSTLDAPGAYVHIQDK